MSRHLRILLSEATSAALTATGEAAFLVIGKASHPDDPKRWALHLLPLDMQTACQASEVALGTRKPGKRIITPPPPPDALTSMLEGKDGITIQRDIHEPSAITESPAQEAVSH